MLFLLLKFLYIIILSFLYGYFPQKFLSRILKNEQEQPSFPLTVLTGLFWICIFAAILSIFIPLSAGAHALILVGALLNFFFYRQAIIQQIRAYIQAARAASGGLKAFFAAAVLYVLYLSAQPSFTYDEGLYYAQFIKWMQYYPTVPGLANLHVRFGFNSHWHVLAAVFNFSWIPGAAGNHLNGVLYLMVVLYLLPRKQDTTFIRALKAGLLILINMPQVCVYNIIAPAADLPVFYLGCLIVVVWLENKSTDLLAGPGAVFLLLAPLFLVTVKVSAVPVLLLTALFLLQSLRKHYYTRVLSILSIGVVMLVPWLIRNIILSGYPLFPMELPDLFHTGWRVPLSVVHATRQDITAFAFYRAADIAKFMTDSWSQRFVTWFGQHLRVYDKLLLLVTIISPLIVYLRRKSLPENFLPLYAFLMLGCCFWLSQAPDPRFAYSYLVPLLVITFLLGFPLLQNTRYVLALSLLATLLFQAGTVVLQKRLHQTFLTEGMVKDTPHQLWLTPTPYTQQAVAVHETPFHLYVPLNTELCWDTPLPCADHMPQGVKMRGTSLRDGFVNEK
ncbi:hypothetical protein SAMN05518672_101990 [Chitinophaga sp. CF118]|uniref:LIC_10190 family membrane protein n=1 Tax=Chitinophaga sp. CF118 TaxID=1884367 RepID=UPI0008ECFAF1|nr:hypothetical protein [Chitinophaga sp. CF118]SFD19628.1 hypothetical protein SAMN05518672_101990 [Chitinophaga sp. CF118]